MDKVESDCVLCVQEADIIGLGHCNHKTFCYQCMIKMRVISKITMCPICKQQLDKIILTDNLNAQFADFQINKLIPITYSEAKDVFYTDSEDIKTKVESLNNFKCPFQECQNGQLMSNYNQLRFHLKDQHQRQFCDVCIEQKTCFLVEQQVYTDYEHRKHLQHGDYDEDGNLIFKHPYCKYCKKNFYDEDKFKYHLNIAHINCNLCDNRKFVFYKDHLSFEKHLKLSHFLCEEPLCKSMLIVFKNAGELDMHKNQSHRNDPRIKKPNQYNIQQFAGFYDNPKQNVQNNDNEGWDFSDQFPSLKQTNLRAVVHRDQHNDEKIDFRDFLYVDYNDEIDKQSDQSEKLHSQQNVHLEDLRLVKPATIPSINHDSFIRKCSFFLRNQKGKEDQIRKMISMFEQERYDPENFTTDFIRLFELKTGLRLITFFMAMRELKERKDLWKKVDDVYFKELQRLPKKNNSIIMQCKTYSELFLKLLDELNINLACRIEKGELKNYADTAMPKERIFQFIEVLRHVKTQEMGKFKFALNFGLVQQVLEHIKQKILLDDFSNIQEHISKISNHDLVPFYLYVNLSSKILKGEQIHKEQKDVNECVYLEYFQKNPKLFNLISKPEVIESSKQQLLQKIPKNQQGSGLDMNAFDFPSLPKAPKKEQTIEQFQVKTVEPQKQQQQEKKQKQNTQSKKGKQEDSGAAIFQYQPTQEESFPSLISQPAEIQPKHVTKVTGTFVEDESFVPLTTYQPVRNLEGTEWDSNPIVPKKSSQMKEVAKIKKKNKTIVQISGGFC
ncbi:unnamed protein product (macronuclear) [Paramecium tetraurelia]|uniref:RING-type E3 ubiquitin transferase n=1 Tax=Paramecium tetraurelia TaxID=5888 RepID=A0BKT2_PARTE|nr:uncharacterized protein GSPATT00029780001 [Paramecium tetraurelia]CAK59149.1 unnamed protein product [Paramecium tetraurelia]|eukprot:XP_001426547.1 hypothetical protein (macronuclear) [Paramecium tetraurelia strain d4-2]